MSFRNARPPIASSNALLSLKPHNFPKDSQPLKLVAGENATKPAAPTDSTGFIPNSQQQLAKAGGHRRREHRRGGGPSLSSFAHVNDSPIPDFDPNYNELVTAPPDHSVVRPPPLPAPGVYGDETNNGGAPGLSFIHINNSPYPNNNDDPLPSRDEVNAPPGLSPFVRVNNSPYPNNDDNPLPSVDEANAPGLASFIRKNNSPYPKNDDLSDQQVPRPPQHSAVRPLEQSSNPRQRRDETNRPPGLTPFVRVNNSPYPNVDPYNGSSTNISQLEDASLTATCVNTLKKCFVCLLKKNWPQIMSISASRTVPIVKQLHLQTAVKYFETTTISNARDHMSAHRTDFLVLFDSDSSLSGVLTKKNIQTRDIPSEFNLVNTPVSKVMTKNPIFVYSDTSALEAMQKMAQGNVTRVPVIENGKVIGLIHQKLCLYHFREAADSDKGIVLAREAIAQWNT